MLAYVLGFGLLGLTAARPSLEDLAFFYGTDKGHDDHKYTDLYHALFEPIRDRVLNITEIGVALGQSLQVWHDYFENANVYGVDIHWGVIKRARKMFIEKPRVHIMHANSKSNSVSQLGLTEGSSRFQRVESTNHDPSVDAADTAVAWMCAPCSGHHHRRW